MPDFEKYVLNRHRKHPETDNAVYVGRGTDFGNKFLFHPNEPDRELTRAESIAWYELWLARENGLLRKVKGLKGKYLLCSCEPKLCHAHLLAFVANADRETQLRWYHYIRSLSEPRLLTGVDSWNRFMPKPKPLFRVELGEGKYTYVREATGEQYALRRGKPWRDLAGDNFVAALGYRIEELEQRLENIAKISGYSEDLTRKLEITLEQHVHDLALNNRAWIRGE